jgi:hypothetical protein
MTMLRISNMTESDAGTYEAKIDSVFYESDLNHSPDCDTLVLPPLENIADQSFSWYKNSMFRYMILHLLSRLDTYQRVTAALNWKVL